MRIHDDMMGTMLLENKAAHELTEKMNEASNNESFDAETMGT